MKINLEKEIHLNVEPEHKSLYSWSLRESASSAQKIERDLIPWAWSLYFLASELRHSRTFEIKREGEARNLAEEKEVISGILYPGSHSLNGESDGEPSYSMFGTDRYIKKFRLGVQKTEGETAERCQIWGGVSYTSEMDFRYETTEDEIDIWLWVTPARFENLKELITANRVDVLQVRLVGVSGFYSEWSPSITTRRIKVLARSKDQTLITSSDSEIAPPRLGDVGEFVLDVIQRNKIVSEPVIESQATDVTEDYEEAQKSDDDGEQVQIREKKLAFQEEFYQRFLTQMSRNELALSKVQASLVVVIVFLALISFKLWF